MTDYLNPDKPTFDASIFNDPLAKQVEWTQIDAYNTGRKLVQIDENIYKYKPYISDYITSLICTPGILFVLFIFVYAENISRVGGIAMSLFAVLMAAFTYILWSWNLKSLTFNFQTNQLETDFFIGPNPPKQAGANQPTLISLDSLHAMQVISRKLDGKKIPYKNQLNLIFEDGSRVHVITISDLEQLIEDGAELSRVLDKPLWVMDLAFPELKSRQFDPKSIDDPLAAGTEWTFIAEECTDHRSFKLLKINPNRYELKPIYVGCSVVVLLTPVILISFFTLPFLFSMFFGLTWLHCTASIISFAILLLFLYVYSSVPKSFLKQKRPIIFDLQVGDAWKGKKPCLKHESREKLERAVEIENIHAIQIVSEKEGLQPPRYYSHEINLVLKDGKRANVIHQKHLGRLRKHACELADWLDVPIWDAAKEDDPNDE